MKKALNISLLFIVIAALLFSGLNYTRPNVDRQAKSGVLDLRNLKDFNRMQALKGEWEFYWKQLVFPEGKDREKTGFVSYPSLWQEVNFQGKPLPSQGFATYGLTILLPPQRPPLSLEIPSVYSSYRLYVNDHLVSSNGVPGETASTSSPYWNTGIVHLPLKGDTLRLLMQVANYWHTKGGPNREILLGERKAILLKDKRDDAFDLFLTGCLFMGGLFFLGLYIFGRHDKTILFFSLFCIVYSYRLIGVSSYVLHDIFPGLNWFLTIRLEYLSLTLGVACFAEYTGQLYPKETNTLFKRIIVYSCLLYSLMIICTPAIVFTRLITAFLCIMFLYIGYALYVYIQAARHKRTGADYALMSTAVMLLVFIIINLNYFGMIPPLKGVVFTGYILFFFLQSLILSHRFAYTLKSATQQAEQGLKSKSEFLSTMSHEIRTPLNAVIGMTHILRENDPRKDQEEHLDVLLFSANNLLSIVNDILDYNKIEAGKIRFENIPVDLGSIAQNIVTGLNSSAEEKGIVLKLDIDEQLKRKVMGDPTRISQVMNNLVHNAIKFTNQGWVKLRIRVEIITGTSVTLLVEVEDTGIGIAPDKQKLIFERFTQADSSTSRRYGGTGLGLSICKKILELLGTKLELASEAGSGSKFFFRHTFLFSNESTVPAPEKKPQTRKDTQQLKGLPILLAEDNAMNVLVAKTFLERGGAIIDVATNGQEVLDMLDSKRHQLILMDLQMPVMDGLEATLLLRQKGETLPIIALTASMPAEVQKELTAAGLNDIVVKPFNPDDMFRVILQYVQPSVRQ